MKKQWLLIGLWILFSSYMSAFSQKGWTLDECIEYALSNNLELNQQFLVIDNNKAEYRQSKLDFLPSLAISNSSNTYFGKYKDPSIFGLADNKSVTRIDFSPQMEMEIFAGLKKHYTIQKAKIDLDASIFETEALRNDLIINIIQRYLETILAKENVKIINQKIEILNIQIIRTNKLIEAEKNVKGDLFQLESQLYESQNQLLDAKQQESIAILKLCQLLNIHNETQFDTISPEGIDIQVFDSCDYHSIINNVSNLPEIKSVVLKKESAAVQTKISKASLWPKLVLNVGYGSFFSTSRRRLSFDSEGNPLYNETNELVYKNYPFAVQLRDSWNGYAAFRLDIPIFNKGIINRQVRSAQLSHQWAEYDLHIKRSQATSTLKQILLNTQTLYDKYCVLKNNIQTSQEAFKFIEKKVNSEAASYYDYILSLNNLTIAQSQIAYAKYEYIFYLKILDFYSDLMMN